MSLLALVWSDVKYKTSDCRQSDQIKVYMVKSDTQASGVHLSDYSSHNRGKERTVFNNQYVCPFDGPNRDALCESSSESKELLQL